MFIAVDELVDVGDDAGNEQLEQFLDAFTEMVVSLGYTCTGSVKLVTGDKISAELERQIAERAACHGLTTEQLEVAGKGATQRFVDILTRLDTCLETAWNEGKLPASVIPAQLAQEVKSALTPFETNKEKQY